jgi:hypothetical protein
MRRGISKRVRTEVIAALHQRYLSTTKKEKARNLGEFVNAIGSTPFGFWETATERRCRPCGWLGGRSMMRRYARR